MASPGLLVPPKDPEALAVRMGFLMANPALGAAMGRAGIHRVRLHFTWAQVARQLVEVYAGLAETEPRATVPERGERMPSHLSLVQPQSPPESLQLVSNRVL